MSNTYLQTSRKDLVLALKTVKAAVRRGTLPCLSYVTLAVAGSKLTVQTFDLDLAISHWIPCDATGNFTVCVPFKNLYDMVSGKNGPVTVAIHDDGSVECDPFKGKLPVIALEDMLPMPALTPMAEDQVVSFTEALTSGLRMVAPAMSTDETRYVLNGIYFGLGNGGFDVMATDGRRLHKVALAGGNPTAMPFILPRAAVKALLGIGDLCGRFEQFNEPWVKFTFGKTTLVSKVIEGQFPNYRQVIPSETEGITVVLPCKATAAIMDRAGKFGKGKLGNQAAVRLAFTNSGADVTCTMPDKGEMLDRIECDGSKVVGLVVGYNPVFLRDVMEAGDSETMQARFKDALSPVLLTSGNFMAVVMPVRLG